MTFRTDQVSPVLERILLLTGSRVSEEVFTSELKTVKLSSEHLGVPNQEIVLSGMYLRYVPSGNDDVRISWRVDNQATQGFTVNLNPFSYGVMGADEASTTFFSSGSVSCTDMTDPDDVYTYFECVSGQGKTVEVTISTDEERDNHILGLELELTLGGKGQAYVSEAS